MRELDDVRLLEACKSGDRQAFNELVRRNQERVYWTVRKILNDHDEALDVSQDVFVKAYQNIHKFRGDSQISTWLYRIATNLSINELRRKKGRASVSLDDVKEYVEDVSDTTVSMLEDRELREIIERAVETLPEKQKLVFVLRYYQELPYDEIAKILKKSVGGLKANYFHAVRKIEEYVRNELDET